MTETKLESEIKQNLDELFTDIPADIASHVTNHLSHMYADVWDKLTPSMRKSMRGAIINACNFHLKQLKGYMLKDETALQGAERALEISQWVITKGKSGKYEDINIAALNEKTLQLIKEVLK